MHASLKSQITNHNNLQTESASLPRSNAYKLRRRPSAKFHTHGAHLSHCSLYALMLSTASSRRTRKAARPRVSAAAFANARRCFWPTSPTCDLLRFGRLHGFLPTRSLQLCLRAGRWTTARDVCGRHTSRDALTNMLYILYFRFRTSSLNCRWGISCYCFSGRLDTVLVLTVGSDNCLVARNSTEVALCQLRKSFP